MSYNKTKYIDTDFPELIPLFEDKTNLHIPKSSKEKRIVICPCCKNKYDMKIVNLVKAGHVTCPTCNDGFSYPEKLMANILNDLNINYTYQFSPYWANGYRYDFLILNNIIIELDGGLGHGNVSYVKDDVSKSKKKDLEKDKLAIDNGYIIYRIDCYYKNHNKYEYIKESIISCLNNVIKVDDIDWDKCNQKALSSLFNDVINCYNNQTIFVDEISKLLNIKSRTIHKYLKEAMRYGILPFKKIVLNNPFKDVPIDIKIVFNTDSYTGKQKFIYCYDDKILFGSFYDACKYYNFDYEVFVYNVKNNNYYNGKIFKPIDNIKTFNFNKIPKLKYNIYQYDKNYNLLFTYHSTNELPDNYLYSSIWKAIKKKRKTAYGYIWSNKLLEAPI